MKTVQDYARHYVAQGFCVIPNVPRGKRPYHAEWQSLRIKSAEVESFFQPTDNIGIETGAPSGNRVCVDLDSEAASLLAPLFLPPTQMVCGRTNNPEGHWFYRIDRDINGRKWKLSKEDAEQFGFAHTVELLATGQQVVVGPSIHETGDIYHVLAGEPAIVTADELVKACIALDIAVRAKLGIVEPPARTERNGHTSQPPMTGDRETLLKRATSYLARIPPAVSGQGGHAHTFTTAIKLVAFGLSRDDVFGLLSDWNSDCDPPWTDADLSHKIDDAFKADVEPMEDRPRTPNGSTAGKNTQHLPTQPPEQRGKPRLCRQSEQFKSFPTEILPGPVRRFVMAESRAIDCDESFVALPALSALAASIGNTRRICLKRSWTEPSIIWTALVANSGTRKSPPIDAGTKPMRERQSNAFASHAVEMRQYEGEVAEYNAATKKHRGDGKPPQKPDEPVCERFIANDLTIEGLVYLLKHQPRGLLVCRDELDGWLGGFDQYKSGKGSDLSNWLELHGGRSLTIDRKTGTPRTLHIPRAAASLCGGIQPGVLSSRLTSAHVASGLVARILFAFPPSRPRRWTDADVDDRITHGYSQVVGNLLAIPFGTDENGEPEPVLVGLSPDSKQRFARFVNEHGAQQADLDDAMSASFAKLEGYAARFALVLHLARWASGEPVDPTICDEASVEAGIVLSRWFANEAKRVHGMLTETPADTELRQLAEWVSRRGGRATARDVCRLNRKYPTAEEAESALTSLVDSGSGHWRDIPSGDVGGRPTREFCQRIADETPANSLENEGCVGNSAEEIPQRGWVDTEVTASDIDFDHINELFPVGAA